jgi:hypothetical protein
MVKEEVVKHFLWEGQIGLEGGLGLRSSLSASWRAKFLEGRWENLDPFRRQVFGYFFRVQSKVNEQG